MSETDYAELSGYELAKRLKAVRTEENKHLLSECATRLWYLDGKAESQAVKIAELEAQKGGLNVPLTDAERAALEELSQSRELSPERVMVQALRLYQMVHRGHARLLFPTDEEMMGRILFLTTDEVRAKLEAEGIDVEAMHKEMRERMQSFRDSEGAQ